MSDYQLDQQYQHARANALNQMAALTETVEMAKRHLFGGPRDTTAFRIWAANISMGADQLNHTLRGLETIRDAILDKE